MADSSHHKIVIIGGGTAGIIVAALLRRAGQSDILLIEPSTEHFYQPIWTLVGAGVVEKEVSVRAESAFVPRGVKWLRESVAELVPDRHQVVTNLGNRIGYDFVVVAPGLEYNWNAIPGLREAVDSGAASTNYGYDIAPRTWKLIREFKGGTALFHMPGTPIKCPGAPQKIMYLAADHFRRKGIARDVEVIFGSATASIYGIKEYAAVLNRVVERYGIDARFNHELIEVRPDKKEAVFRIKNGSADDRTVIPYDIMHVVPPQQAPDFVRHSPLADLSTPLGWLKVDKYTMQNPDYPEVFALGDVGNTPNSKTGASARWQAKAVVENLLSLARGKEPSARYNGYVACPIITGYGKMLLCEFDYTGKPTPLLPFIDTFKERYDMWLLKRYALPWAYWNLILYGHELPFLRTYEIPEPVQPVAAARAA